jgi:hypothetical protein
MILMKLLKRIFTIIYLVNSCLCWDYFPSNQTDILIGDIADGSSICAAALGNSQYIITHEKQTTEGRAIFYTIISYTGTIFIGPVALTDNIRTRMWDTKSFIAPDTVGGFVVIWNGADTSPPTGGNNVFAKYIDNRYNPSPDVRLSSANMNISTVLDSTAIMLLTGHFITFYGPDLGGGNFSIIAQKLFGGVMLQNYQGAQTITTTNGNTNLRVRCMNLQDGTVAVAWTVDTAIKVVVAMLIDPSNLATTKGKWEVSDNTVSSDYPTIATLANSNFVIAYQEVLNENIMATVYSSTGDSLNSRFKVNSLTKCANPVVKPLDDGFIVIYTCVKEEGTSTYKRVFSQLFSNSGEALGGETEMNKIQNTYDITSNPYISGLLGTSFLVAYAVKGDTGNKLYYRLFTKDNNAGLCNKFTIINNTMLSTKVTFNSLTSSTVVLTTLPKYARLSDLNNNNLSKGVAYLTTEIVLNPISLTKDSFYYSVNNGYSSCQVTINTDIVCLSSCATCTGVGDSSDNKCVDCNTAVCYNKLVGTSNCITTSDKPVGYYLKGDTWEKCHELCKSCTSTAVGSDMKCEPDSCIQDYFPKEDNMTSCYQGTVSGYLFDNVLKVYKKQATPIPPASTASPAPPSSPATPTTPTTPTPPSNSCFNLCQSCSGYPTNPAVDMLCNPNSCISGYYPKFNKMTSCFKVDNPISGFYFDGYIFQKCYSLCESCKQYPSNPEKDMSCDTCISGTYPKQNNSTSCFSGNIESYYFDTTDKIYKKCYSLCQTCSQYAEGESHFCLSCKSDHYPLGKSSNCYKKDENVEGYYLDGSTFSPCFDSCKTCKGPGSLANPNCSTCKAGKSCNNCTDIVYDNQCLTKCPDDTLYDDKLNTCYACKNGKLLQGSSCVNECDSGYYNKTFICASCESGKLLNQNGKCVESCNEGYVVNEGKCISCKLTYINLVNKCTESTCQNGGNCVIQSGTISCSCKQQYTGLYCELLNTPADLRNYIGKNYF